MRDETADVYARIHNRVDEILHYVWDPIGVAGSPGARDEYDTYVPEVVRMLFKGSDSKAIESFLQSVESEAMGMSLVAATAKRRRHAADTLIENYRWITERDHHKPPSA